MGWNDIRKAIGEAGMRGIDPTGERRAVAELYRQNAQAQEQENQQRAMLARRSAMVQDALQANRLLKEGRVDAAMMLVNDRLVQLRELGADPSDTQRVADMLYNGDIQSAIAATDAVVEMGYQAGLLKPPGAEGGWKPESTKIEGNQAIVNVAPGQWEARSIAGMAPPPEEPAFDPEAQRKYLQDARKGITQLKTNFRETQEAFNKIESAATAGNPTGDLAMTIQLMKLLDPGSVVREGEQDMVRNTAAIPDRLWNAYNAAAGKGSLTPEQRAEILGMAREFYQGQQFATDVAVFEQLQFAKADGFSIARVLGEDGAKRWEQKVYRKQAPSGEVVELSLVDILTKAQREGVRPVDIARRYGIDINKPGVLQ